MRQNRRIMRLMWRNRPTGRGRNPASTMHGAEPRDAPSVPGAGLIGGSNQL